MLDVLRIAALTQAADGVAPLDEATLLAWRHHPESLTVWGDHRGFGLLHDRELSLVVVPHERGTGLGTRLLREAPAEAQTAWSHGDHPAARALAASHGWVAARELWVMRRGGEGLDKLDLRGTDLGGTDLRGVDLRGFRAGDEAELLRVNAAAFADHPEQSALSLDGLRERMAEAWFSAEGLIGAWRGDRLLAFHWTKRHSPALGEVYVVGVDPAAQGQGLGRLVTLAGLNHLASVGVEEIHLYVEADNAPAVALYTGLGFGHDPADTHVQYRRG